MKLEMSTRLHKIRGIKQQIFNLQRQIKQLQSPSHSLNKPSSKINNKCTSSNPAYRNQTFWNTDPILQIETPKKSRSKSNERDLNRSISPVAKRIQTEISAQYFSHCPSSIPLKQRNINDDINQKDMKSIVRSSKRFQHSHYGTRNQTPRFQKRRTYAVKQTDIILNPEKDKETNRKIVKVMSKSPEQMLTENPNSNKNLYVFDNKVSCLSRKGAAKLNKNQSKEISLVFSSSLQNISQKMHTPAKKHFQRYIQQNIFSKWK